MTKNYQKSYKKSVFSTITSLKRPFSSQNALKKLPSATKVIKKIAPSARCVAIPPPSGGGTGIYIGVCRTPSWAIREGGLPTLGGGANSFLCHFWGWVIWLPEAATATGAAPKAPRPPKAAVVACCGTVLDHFGWHFSAFRAKTKNRFFNILTPHLTPHLAQF